MLGMQPVPDLLVARLPGPWRRNIFPATIDIADYARASRWVAVQGLSLRALAAVRQSKNPVRVEAGDDRTAAGRCDLDGGDRRVGPALWRTA